MLSVVPASAVAQNVAQNEAGTVERAVVADLVRVSLDTPFFNSLRAAALALAREIDDEGSRAAKAPLVKQLVDTIRELKGKDVRNGNSVEALLAELAAPLPGVNYVEGF